MAVTDLTDALPWWARQGGGPTGGPAATPGGAGVGAAPQGGPPAGVSSDQWLQYLQQMFGQSGGQVGPPLPLGGATPMSPGANPADMPSPDASNMAAMFNVSNPAPNPNPPGPGNVNVVPPAAALSNPLQDPLHPLRGSVTKASQQPPPAYDPLSGGSANTGVAVRGPPPPPAYDPLSGGSANTGRPPGYGPPPQPPYNPLSGGSANTGLPPVNPNAPAPNVSPVANVRPAAAALPGPLAANSRFIGIDRPNAPAESGGRQGRGGTLQGTALNLAGLFGPQQPQGAPAAIPGPLASRPTGVRPGNFPYGQSTTPGGPLMPFDITGLPVAGVNAPLGSPPMNPDQLGSAVKKPNWWRNV